MTTQNIMDLTAWKIEPGDSQFFLHPLNIPPHAHTFDQLSKFLPAGAYTTLRTYTGHKVLRLDAHFERLESTACLAGHPLALDRNQVRRALRQVITGFPAGQEVRLRLTLDLQDQLGAIYIVTERLRTPPPGAYQTGARAVTCTLERQLPKAKLTRFIARAESVRQHLPPEVNEALMVSPDGRILEGLSSNFFAVKDGEIWTADEGVLSGTTRLLVLEAINRLGLPLIFQAFPLADLDLLEEAFITSASRGILPVIQIDKVKIGSGLPGILTRRLMAEYETCLLADLEPV